jgi:hypothetical protein
MDRPMGTKRYALALAGVLLCITGPAEQVYCAFGNRAIRVCVQQHQRGIVRMVADSWCWGAIRE